MNILKLLGKIGLSCHDILITLSILETLWWVMYSFNDGADALLRMQLPGEAASKQLYHPFIMVQKLVAIVKLVLSCSLIWYGTIIRGKARPIFVYLLMGMLVDAILLLSWITIAIEESWPLTLSNMYGLHYIIIFVTFRAGMYWMLHQVCNEIFSTGYGQSVVGTMNGDTVVVGLPERVTTTVNSGNNLAFIGKGVRAILEYYRDHPEKAFLVCIFWDLLWNLSIVVSQEIPEVLFNIIFIGHFGSLSLDLPTESLLFRVFRIFIVLGAVYVVNRKVLTWLKFWSILYLSLMLLNAGFFCLMVSIIAMDETTTAIVILCTVFFASIAAKILVLFTSARFYYYLRKENSGFVNQNNNENE